MGTITRTVVPSWEPQPVLWYNHGNHDPHCGTIMGTTTRTMVPSWEPQPALWYPVRNRSPYNSVKMRYLTSVPQ